MTMLARTRRYLLVPARPTLQAYITDRLIRQRRVSPHTIRAYRDTIRLLVTFAAERRHVGVEARL